MSLVDKKLQLHLLLQSCKNKQQWTMRDHTRDAETSVYQSLCTNHNMYRHQCTNHCVPIITCTMYITVLYILSRAARFQNIRTLALSSEPRANHPAPHRLTAHLHIPILLHFSAITALCSKSRFN